MTAAPELTVFDTQDQALVKKWIKKIKNAKEKWKDDYERMRENMKFAAGLQWAGQKKIETDKYTINIVLRNISQKVATLYAKNPTVEAVRRQRMDFQVWDESVQSLQEAMGQAQMAVASGMPLPVELGALLADVATGRAKQKLITKAGRTLQIATQYFMDSHRPDFKEQMKQLVRRTCTCGVGYVKPVLCITGTNYASSVDHGSDMDDRLGRIQSLVQHLKETGESDDSAHFGTLRSLTASLQASAALGEQDEDLPERIDFDFPPSTSIVVDEACRHVKDFVGARWIAQEYVLPVGEVNAIFGTEVEVGSGEDLAREYQHSGQQAKVYSASDCDDPLVCLYEVSDYNTKTRFFVVDGWKDYVRPPEVNPYGVSGFWEIRALTFNDIEVEPGLEVSPFPPSDVDIMRHPQKEWNRTRDALRAQRNANSPKYLTRKNFLTEEDIEKIRSAEPNEVLEISGAPMDQPVDKLVVPMVHAPIDDAMYVTAPHEQDIMLGTGMQQANLGPAQANVTATVATVAEQSRADVSSSNVDDVDGLLSWLACATGEMTLKGVTKPTIIRIVGEGAVFPETPMDRKDFLNEIFLSIQAASSGRPNKALDIANYRDLAPTLLQAGANPVAIVEEGARRLDDNLDLDRFFPLSPPDMAQGGFSPAGEDSDPTSQSSPGSEQNMTTPEVNSSIQTPPGVALAG